MNKKTLFPFGIIAVLLAAVLLIGLPENSTTAPDSAIAQSNDDDEPIVVTVEVPVTVEVTREVTVIVTPTFTPLPPTPTPLPAELTVDDDNYIGAEDAPVKVVEFSDYRCGFCGRFYATTLRPLTQHYGDLIQFVYRDFPIFGQESLNGAVGAECGGEQGKFWEFHNAIFDNQLQDEPAPLTRDTLEGFARNLELDIEEWRACFESDAVYDEVLNDATNAQAWGVTGTPSFFINGELLVGAQPLQVFLDVIDAELESAGIDPPPRPER